MPLRLTVLLLAFAAGPAAAQVGAPGDSLRPAVAYGWAHGRAAPALATVGGGVLGAGAAAALVGPSNLTAGSKLQAVALVGGVGAVAGRVAWEMWRRPPRPRPGFTFGGGPGGARLEYRF